jgi:S1-C subfamily serine protease
VVNRSGKVVGVVASGFLGAQNLNFAVPVDQLRKLSEEARRNPQGAELGIPWQVTLRNAGLSLGFLVIVVVLYRRYA